MNLKTVSNKLISEEVERRFWFKLNSDLSRWYKKIQRVIQDAKIRIEDAIEYIWDWIVEAHLDRYRDALAFAVKMAKEEDIPLDSIIITLDWRDASWKWSNISRVTKDLKKSIRTIVESPSPTNHERIGNNWFDRYKNKFPNPWMMAFFDRSWYNRSGVEAAMGFCTEEEFLFFMDNVIPFELKEIFEKWYKHLKIYLSITKETQKYRLDRRLARPRKERKSSRIDQEAQEKRKEYTLAKYITLLNTNHSDSQWMVVDSNKKYLSAIEIMKAIIRTNPRLCEIVQNARDIDLSPNPKVLRTAEQELIIMNKNNDLKDSAKKKWMSIKEVTDLKNIWKIFNFDTLEARKLREEEEIRKANEKIKKAA